MRGISVCHRQCPPRLRLAVETAEDGVARRSQGFDLLAPQRVGHHLARQVLRDGASDELAHFRARAPGMPYAHPTVEHLTPMFVTLGAATDPGTPPEQVIDDLWKGLAERSFQVA